MRNETSLRREGVDDEPPVVELHSRMLTKLGYQPIPANSGEEAVEYLKHNQADLVLLDLVMAPGLDGVDTFRQVKALHPHQKGVILSGYAQPSKVAAMRDMGVTHYLIKPVPMGILAQAIRDELDAR